MQTFWNRLAITFAVALLPAGCASRSGVIASSEPSIDDPATIRAILREWIGETPHVGIAVGLITEYGKRVITYGSSGQENVRPLDSDSVFEIGSITKVFTSLLLADMAARGEVNLTDGISKFLPPDVKLPTDRSGREITLLSLATHTSGLPRMPTNFSAGNWAEFYAQYTEAQMYEFLSRCTLTNDIGAKWYYSNLGGGLLGHTLARRAGTDYEALVIERICKPLKMNSTRIRLTPKLCSCLASGHDETGNPASNWEIKTLAGAGALRSTPNDMLNFLAANLEMKRYKLSPAIRRTHRIEADTTLPDLKVCLGWHLLAKHGREILWHNGETGGYHCFIGFDTHRKRGVVVMANFKSWIDDIGLHLLDHSFELKPPNRPKQ